MTQGIVKIYLSVVEPSSVDNILWLRPYLDKEGYELLFFSSNGWMPLCLCKQAVQDIQKPEDSPEEDCPCDYL